MFLLFFLAWIIFNGKITIEIILIGLGVSALVFAFMCKFMDYSVRREKKFYKDIHFLARYVVILVKEIILANVAVIHMVWTQKEVMEPVIVEFRTNLKSDTARVILANSITLTPGTITVALEEDKYTVHCLDKSLAEGMDSSLFVSMLEAWEKREDK